MPEISLSIAEQKALLVSDLAKLQENLPVAASTFYECLFQLAPDLRERFEGVPMETQGEMVFQAIGILVNGLDRLDELTPIIHGLGHRHGEYGVHPDYYQFAIEAVVATFQELEGDSFSALSETIWRQVLGVATDLMIAGSEVREQEMLDSNTESTDFEPYATAKNEYLARFFPAPIEECPEQTIPPGDQLEASFELTFSGEKTTTATPLQTILQISRENGIPHFSECGGMAKCTTCRVVILEGRENVLPPNQLETALARERGFTGNVRLGCQTRVTGPVTLKRLVLDPQDADEVLDEELFSAGREMNIAVMFADIRDYSALTRNNLPYDVIHALNRYLRGVCEEIDRHNGYVDKFMGDGVMALFGLSGDGNACTDAVNAAVSMQKAMNGVNAYQREHLGVEISTGIGIHYGAAVIGQLGFRHKKQFTAVGEIVNIASRVEGMTRVLTSDILISDSVHAELNESNYDIGPPASVSLKGKETPLTLHPVNGLL